MVKNYILLAALVRKIWFIPLKNKSHIFAPPCNILYIFSLILKFSTCFAGLGEVSESLVKDQNLTPADFLNDQHLSPKISDLQENSNDYHLTPKPVDCNEFKTPLTSRYGHKVSETPSLFSQDDQSVTPLSGVCHRFVHK